MRSIFSYEGCKPVSSIRKDIENTWFVIMDSEEDAKDTILDLKLKKRTFRGEPVKCRLKTEAVVKSYFPVPGNSYGSVAPPYGMGMPYGQMDSRVYGGYGGGWQNNQASGDSSKSSEGRAGNAAASPKDSSRVGSGVPGSPPKDGRKDNQHKGGKDNSRDRKGGQQRNGSGRDGSGRNNQSGRDKGNNNGGKNSKGDSKTAQKSPGFDISGMNFPPLAAHDTPAAIPTPGYAGEYTKYTHDDIINIVKNIREVVLPESIHPELHSDAMTDTPNMDLLQRQRTFSIDETREQLRQGRPVQREAVVAGAVDIESMYYGDRSPAAGTAAPADSKKPAKAEGGSWAGVLMKSGPPSDAAVKPGSGSNASSSAKRADGAPVSPDSTVEVVSTGEDKKLDPTKAASAEKKGKSEKKNKDPKVFIFASYCNARHCGRDFM